MQQIQSSIYNSFIFAYVKRYYHDITILHDILDLSDIINLICTALLSYSCIILVKIEFVPIRLNKWFSSEYLHRIHMYINVGRLIYFEHSLNCDISKT